MAKSAQQSTFPTASRQLSPQGNAAHLAFDAAQAAYQKSEFQKAEEILTAHIKLHPSDAKAWHLLGLIYFARGYMQTAIDNFTNAIRCDSTRALYFLDRGKALKMRSQPKEAIEDFHRATVLNPKMAESHYHKADALGRLRQFDEAIESYKKAITLAPHYIDAYSHLALLYTNLAYYVEAEALYIFLTEKFPENATFYNSLANIFKHTGRLSEAQSYYKKAILIKPDFDYAHSNLLLTQQYDARISPQIALAESLEYGAKVSARATPKFTEWKQHSRAGRVKIGFLSADLRLHTVGYLLEHFLKHINRDEFELIAYSCNKSEDALTEKIKSATAHWRNIADLSDGDAARLIHADGVDVLIDFSGHTSGNRLPVFAYRPAPIQMSAIGYFATTGLPEMDYFLVSPHAAPDAVYSHFSERLIYIKETHLCFPPPADACDVAPLPALKNGYVTFGCFNNASKYSAEVFALWAEILLATPTAKLFLKSKSFADNAYCASVMQQFQAHGVDDSRLRLEGEASRAEYFQSYHDVDIALDPFPFPGGATSADALWMGVPVLTLKGDRLIAHQGEMIAHAAGLPHFIAADVQAYREKACFFAQNLQALSRLRHELRPKLEASPLFDGTRYARNFEEVLRALRR